MKKYCVGWASLFENILSLEYVEAANPVDAMLQVLRSHGYDTSEESPTDIEECSAMAFNWDVLISARELPKSS